MIILGTYIFIMQTVNAGGVQIMLGAAIGGMGYIFFEELVQWMIKLASIEFILSLYWLTPKVYGK